MRDVLHTLLASREEENHRRGKDKESEIGNKEGQVGMYFKEFVDCKPTEFSGKYDLIAAMTWLTHTENKFRSRKCEEKDKVDFTTNLLTGAAHYWWDMMISTLGEELISMLTWDQFA
uniref:Retrotransposon gag domain-containing protein n=1 Tax=Lactuca sativa TaxID=4236 RepID=A0A9R1XL44_LACSA|nr:hypothetical protein LSAT_V11C400200480 [Lactuca sativa]